MPERRNEGFQRLTLGAVKADGTPDIAQILFSFPVPHQQMTVTQAVKIDEVSVPGRSGKVKQAVGYEDTEISLSLQLVDEEIPGGIQRSALDQLHSLQAAFRDRSDPVGESDNAIRSTTHGVPTIFSIQSRLTDACGIKTVLFQGMTVGEQPGDTALNVEIRLTEFEPVARQVERRRREAAIAQTATAEAREAAGGDASASRAHDEQAGEESPLARAFRQGKADAMGGTPQ